MGAEVCMLRTWKGGMLRGVPVHQEDGKVGTKDISLPPGLLIPAQNVEGLITGLQLRSRAAKESVADTADGSAPEGASPQASRKTPKYLWVSKDKSVKGAAGVLPFFCVCCRWSCRQHTVALVEGGLKAYVFAFLTRRFPVIGASGG